MLRSGNDRWSAAAAGLILLTTAAIGSGAASAAAAPPAPSYAVAATIPVGNQPTAIAVNPQTGKVYVGNSGDGSVSIVTTSDNAVAATVPVTGRPLAIATNPVTDRAYVTTVIGDSGAHDGDLVEIDGANAVSNSRDIQSTLTDGPHFGVAVNTVTDAIYVSHFYSGRVSEISGSDFAHDKYLFPAGPIVMAVAVDELKNTIYVANLDAFTVTVVNGATRTPVEAFSVVGHPSSIAVDPSRQLAYVATSSNIVEVVDTVGNTVVKTVRVGQTPGRIAVDSRAGVVYVPDKADNTVSVIDQATNTVTATIDVGTAPDSVAVDPGTHAAYVTNTASNTVSVIRTIVSTPVITDLPASAAVGGSFTATVDTTGDGTTSVTSSTPAVCTASGLTVTYVGAGTCTLTAAVSAGTRFSSGVGSPQSFLVSAATQPPVVSPAAPPATAVKGTARFTG